MKPGNGDENPYKNPKKPGQQGFRTDPGSVHPEKAGNAKEEKIMNRYQFSGMPLETEIRLRQGREFAQKGNDREALVCFRQAAFIAPASSGAYRETADCLSRLGRFDEAEMYYRKFQDRASYRRDTFR